eukprot:XP_001704727.1 Hypothetical protein GL50803_34467 [Giardia lamblia ATCC 50803]
MVESCAPRICGVKQVERKINEVAILLKDFIDFAQFWVATKVLENRVFVPKDLSLR